MSEPVSVLTICLILYLHGATLPDCIVAETETSYTVSIVGQGMTRKESIKMYKEIEAANPEHTWGDGLVVAGENHKSVIKMKAKKIYENLE